MDNAHTMQCMEVWGGNQPVDCGVVMAGLDAWVFSKPYENADGGGDVHYVSSCATGRITRLLLADVSGHGATVARVGTSLRNLMRRFINYIDQTQFVRAMNEQFNSVSDSPLFATAVVTTFFAQTNTVSICNAGHPPPLHFRKDKGEWTILEQQRKPSKPGAAQEKPAALSNMPLGIIDLSLYEQFSIRAKVGDMVLSYTDSLIECKNGNDELIGVEGLMDVVKTVDASDPALFISRLLQKLRELNPANLEEDDVSALLFRVNGLAPRLTMGEQLKGTLTTISQVFKSLKPGGPPAPWPEFTLPNLGGALTWLFRKSKAAPVEDDVANTSKP